MNRSASPLLNRLISRSTGLTSAISLWQIARMDRIRPFPRLLLLQLLFSVLACFGALPLRSAHAAEQGCLTTTTPPPEEWELLASKNFGEYLYVPNDDKLVVATTHVEWDPDHPTTTPTGGVWVYDRLATGKLQFSQEFRGYGGAGDLFQNLNYVTAFGEYIFIAAGQPAVSGTHYNYTVMKQVLDGTYVKSQILIATAGTEAAVGQAQGTICACKDWVFALFFTVGFTPNAYTLRAFQRNQITGLFTYHSAVTTTTSFALRLAVDPDCNNLAIRTPLGSGDSYLQIYRFDGSTWVKRQEWTVAPTGHAGLQRMVMSANHLVLGYPLQTYNMTDENKPFNPLNLTAVVQAGIVSVFAWNGTGFNPSQDQLFQKTPGDSAKCGGSLDIYNDTIVVGCGFYNTSFSFADSCYPHPYGFCNTSTCASELVPGLLFIRGRMDQYRLNPDTGEFDYVTTRDEICDPSQPFTCNTQSEFGLFGAGVAAYKTHTFATNPVDYMFGQIYDYTDDPFCGICPCKTDPPCHNGGVCKNTTTAPFFVCTCPTNFTGVHCSDPVPVPTPGKGKLDGGEIAAISFGSVVFVAVVALLAIGLSGACAAKGASGAALLKTGGKGRQRSKSTGNAGYGGH